MQQKHSQIRRNIFVLESFYDCSVKGAYHDSLFGNTQTQLPVRCAYHPLNNASNCSKNWLYRYMPRASYRSAKARELAHMDKLAFGQLLGDRKVPRHYGDDELKDDIAYARSE